MTHASIDRQHNLIGAFAITLVVARPPKPVYALLNESVPLLRVGPLWKNGVEGNGIRVGIVVVGRWWQAERDLGVAASRPKHWYALGTAGLVIAVMIDPIAGVAGYVAAHAIEYFAVVHSRNTGLRGLAHVERRTIATKHFHRRPFGQHRNGRRRVSGEFLRGVNDLSTHDREDGLDTFDFLFGDGEVIIRKRNEVGQLTGSNRTLLPALAAKPTATLSVKP